MGVIHVEIGTEETLRIGKAKVTLVHKSGRKVRLRITAPADVKIQLPDKCKDKK